MITWHNSGLQNYEKLILPKMRPMNADAPIIVAIECTSLTFHMLHILSIMYRSFRLTLHVNVYIVKTFTVIFALNNNLSNSTKN